MATLLHIRSSPRDNTSSYSGRAAQAFTDAYAAAHPGDRVITLDVVHDAIPEFGELAAAGKYKIMRGMSHTPEEAKAWKDVVAAIDAFKAADKYVISAPMWNFGVPHRLKQYLDVIVQPTLTFSFSPDKGYDGLVKGKPAAVIVARGGEYAPGTPAAAYDHQLPYILQILGFIGFTDVKVIRVEPTLHGGADLNQARLEAAKAEAAALARRF